jgi:Fe2+ transport system protein FeoA
VFGLTLASVEPGKTVRIKKLKGTESFKKRLMSMGIMPGVEVLVERIAPLGDPIEVKAKGYRLSLRREEARNILVEE